MTFLTVSLLHRKLNLQANVAESQAGGQHRAELREGTQRGNGLPFRSDAKNFFILPFALPLEFEFFLLYATVVVDQGASLTKK